MSFNIHINNKLKACHTSTLSLYAEDTKMHCSSKNIDLAMYDINKDLKSIGHWFCRNGLILNTKNLEATKHSKPPETLSFFTETQY